MTSERTAKVAFVLPGGGSFGAIQIGMLKALVNHGIKPDFIVGASVGAFNSAYFAARPDADGVAEMETIWRGLKRQDVFPTSLATLWQFLRHGKFEVATSGLQGLIEAHLPYRLIEDAPLPLHILATDFTTGAPVVMSKGPVCEAILASSAVPAAFAPVKIGDRYLIDGAMASKTPLLVAADLGATRIVLLPVGFACANTEPPRGSIAHAIHALTLMMARQLLADVRLLGTSVEISVVPPLCPLAGSPHNFSQTAPFIERAYASTSAWLDRGHHNSCVIPEAMFAHGHA